MFTVAILTQKGGVGKTTLTTTLAVLAELQGETSGILDCDEQATAYGWSLSRKAPKPKGQGKETPPVAAAKDVATLRRAVADARKDGLDWLFIDTPPGVSEIPAEAAAAADLVLIPCVPGIFDMDAVESTVKLVGKLKKPAFFLINRGRSKSINDECAVALTSAYGLPAVNTHIASRMPIVDAQSSGAAISELVSQDSSVEKGKEEFLALWQWLVKQRKTAAKK